MKPMGAFFGFVGSDGVAAPLDVGAVTHALLRRGERVRRFEDRDHAGAWSAILLECENEVDSRNQARGDREERVPRPPVLLFDGPSRSAMFERVSGVREVDSFVSNELDSTTFRGGFAFAMWGRTHRTLALGCDSARIRPLYFCGNGSWFAFSTELRALLASRLVRRSFSEAMLVEYLRSGAVSDGCLVEDVKRLRPGAYIIARRHGWSMGRLARREEAGSTAKDLHATIASQVTPGSPVALLAENEGVTREALVDAVRQVGARPVQLTFGEAPAGDGGAETVDCRVILGSLRPGEVIDACLSSWDQPVSRGIVLHLSGLEAKRVGANVILSDLGVRRIARASFSLKNLTLRGISGTTSRLFDDVEIERLLDVERASLLSPGSAKASASHTSCHFVELSGLTQVANAQSLALSVPWVEMEPPETAGERRGKGRRGSIPTSTIRSWILEDYDDAASQSIEALADAGIFARKALRGFWYRFRHDVAPRTTAQVKALMSLGAWTRRESMTRA